jgi:membrane dipeptidase
MRMVELLGPEHVAFGTDMEGAGSDPVMSHYTELREVVENLAKRGLSEGTLNNICIGNYARVVKQAMNGAAKT